MKRSWKHLREAGKMVGARLLVASAGGAGAMIGWQAFGRAGPLLGTVGAGMGAGLGAWMASVVIHGQGNGGDGTAW